MIGYGMEVAGPCDAALLTRSRYRERRQNAGHRRLDRGPVRYVKRYPRDLLAGIFCRGFDLRAGGLKLARIAPTMQI